MDKISFGTGGWRAVIGVDFIKSNIERTAQGIAELIISKGKTELPVAIGHDRRFLSEDAMKWVSLVLAGNGIKVEYIDRSSPTPLIMFRVLDGGLHYGIEITASHNPAAYNGIKLIVDEGRDAPVELTNELENIIANVTDIRRMDENDALGTGMITPIKNPFNGFIDSILSRLDVDKIKARGPRVLFDPMHGSGTYPLTTILSTSRCTIDVINYNRDVLFGGELPAPTKDTLVNLANGVKVGKYDMGIAFDGDGDRLGIIDSDGTYITANQILVLMYYYLHEYRGWKGPVVRNLATTHMLDKVAEAIGEKCYEVPVGFKYISSKMAEVDAVLGGESSGGMTVRGHINGKDSVYAASLFVEMISVTGKSVGKLWRDLEKRFGRYEMVESNVKFAPEFKEELVPRLSDESALPHFSKTIDRVSFEDGTKYYFGDGSFLICRFSGTEPLLRIFAESSDAASARRLIAEMNDYIYNKEPINV